MSGGFGLYPRDHVVDILNYECVTKQDKGPRNMIEKHDWYGSQFLNQKVCERYIAYNIGLRTN